MFSLRTKLTLALLVTSLAAASIVGVVAQWKLFQKFSSAVMTQSFDSFQADVAEYFTKYGSWENGEASEPFDAFVMQRHMVDDARRGGPRGNSFEPPPPPPLIPGQPPDRGPQRGRGGRGGPPPGPPDGPERPPFRFLLLDADGRVLLPNPPYNKGDTPTPALREAGMPISANGRVVAIAVPLDTPNLSERDDAYLISMREALLFGLGVATVIAIALGLVFGTTLSRTLRRLTAALQAMAAGDLRQRLETTSRDETGVLAETFNRMSADLAKSTEDLQQSNGRIREQAQQLERQNEQLKEAVKLREEVDRIARHDLKTPLTTVIGVPRLLREGGRLRPDEEDLLGIVERAGYRILNMVNLSLDLYKIEQGTYRVRPERVDIRRLIKTVLADVEPHSTAKRIATRVMEEPSDQPLCVWAEELLCYSLLANLLKNAVEASPEGATLTIALRDEKFAVMIDIANVGAVPEQLREIFFEKYATAGKVEGTGLGTYSARLMARVQNGDITMKSSVEEGTTVSVRLPAAVAGERVDVEAGTPLIATPSAGLDLPALRVLLVDDDEYNRFVLSRYLPSPMVVSMAVNGRDAVDVAAAQQPDVILMDVDMPGMNGLEAARAIRDHEQANDKRPSVIIALSSYDDESTSQRSQIAGCDLYLTKPVTRTALHSAIRGLTGSRSSEPTAAKKSASSQDVVQVDPELKDLLPNFMKSRDAVLDEISRALDDGDFAQLRRLAHRLSGSLGLYGFFWASDQARRLEMEAHSGDRAVMAGLVAALKNHLSTAEISCAKAN